MKFIFYGVGLAFCFSESFAAQQTLVLSLNDAIQITLNNNLEILAAQKEIDAAEGKILQAGRIQNPELSLTYNELPTNFSFGAAGEKDIGLSQTIEFPGKRSARIDIAGHEKTIAELSLARTKAIVTADVKRAYYQGLLAKEVFANLEFTINLLSDFLKVVTERYQTGASKYLDVIRAKVELTRLQNDVTDAKREEQTRFGELNVLLGYPGSAPLVLSDSLAFQPLRITQDSAVVYYSNRSNILKIAETDAARNQSLVNLAQTSYLPDFSIGVALQNRPGTISLTGSSTYFGVGVGVSIPLWYWQEPKGEVQKAEASLDISTIRIKAVRLRVQQNILNAFRSASVAQEQLRVFDMSLLRDAEDELRAGISSYQNDQVDALNLFDIYRTVRATKIEYARALYNLLAAQTELEVAGERTE